MTDAAAKQNRPSIPSLPTRCEIEAALRAVGLSNRQAKKFVRVGWPALVGEAQAELDELKDTLAELTAKAREA